MNDLIYLDTETTGLDPYLHEVWEIAYAINDGPVRVCNVPHSIVTADEEALKMNGYWERGIIEYRDENTFDLILRKNIKGNTIVGANPAFDVEFLRKRWGVTPWHYRKIDVESMAFLLFSYDRPKGLADISKDLRRLGYSIPDPDHSAAKDVEVVREVYRALHREQAKMGDAYYRRSTNA